MRDLTEEERQEHGQMCADGMHADDDGVCLYCGRSLDPNVIVGDMPRFKE